jgi:hypothetical protein
LSDINPSFEDWNIGVLEHRPLSIFDCRLTNDNRQWSIDNHHLFKKPHALFESFDSRREHLSDALMEP